jgi:hypothetical protein
MRRSSGATRNTAKGFKRVRDLIVTGISLQGPIDLGLRPNPHLLAEHVVGGGGDVYPAVGKKKK